MYGLLYYATYNFYFRAMTMKTKHTRVLSLFMIILYVLSLMPSFAFAADEELIEHGDFEDAESTALWTGGTRDENAAYEGEAGMQVSNPYGDEKFGNHGHILEYNASVHLEEGAFYTFYAYVANPLGGDTTPEATAYIGRGGDELYIDISSVGYEWSLVSASFMATENSDPSLIISFEGGDSDVGFFIDSVSIVPEDRTPEHASLSGPENVFIPENGYADYRYSLTIYDDENIPINILANDLSITVDNLPKGIDFDDTTGLLRVYPEAEPDACFTLTASVSVGKLSQKVSIDVTTTKNLLTDPGFDNDTGLWSSDDFLGYTDSCLSLYASNRGDWGKYASISYTKQLLLLEGHMYVFRADVRSDEGYPASSVYISNLSFASSGYAEINITGVGGEWSRVTSAFLIEDSGLYDLSINLYAPTDRPVFIDNVYLGVEEIAPTSLSIRAPGNVQIPSDVTVLPCYSNVHNQLGEVMEDLEPAMTISPSDEGVFLDNGEIIVTHGAHAGDYTIEAIYGDITNSLTISVSHDAIGDGGFEVKQANEWWTASDGAIFSIIDYDGDKAGYVYSTESECLVVNNSYMELLGNEYYVFSSAPGFGDGVITAFIADAYTGEYIPFAQYDLAEDTNIPFSIDEPVVGRLVLHIQSDDIIGVIIDDIAIIPAELSATEITVSGGEYGDFLRGSYVYVNNMTDSADADISATRWYISSEYDGNYAPIGIPNQDYLEFSEDMVGQYIIYEVTPICAYTGLVSDALRSLPVLIAADVADDPDVNVPLSQMSPIELENYPEHPFMDITSHWCEAMIAALYNAGVITGRTENRFVPEYYVTRAEFATMVARSFSLVSLPYSGQFNDVSASDWYAGWVEACYKRGIIKGKSDKIFAPNERITREEMAAIIYRAYLLAEGPLPYDMELKYYDSFMISPWAYESVKNCTNLNILTGKEANLYKPDDYATRAEAAACLYRTLKSFY